ncbi:MAG: hypothetical protein QXP51_05180 [Candidatus Hadarchaeales archaeon]
MVKVLYNGMHFEVSTEDEAMELFHQLLSWDRYRYERGEDIPFEEFLKLQESASNEDPALRQEEAPPQEGVSKVEEEAPKEELQKEVSASPSEKRRRRSS